VRATLNDSGEKEENRAFLSGGNNLHEITGRGEGNDRRGRSERWKKGLNSGMSPRRKVLRRKAPHEVKGCGMWKRHLITGVEGRRKDPDL